MTERTMAEVLESTSYGTLYRIMLISGRKLIGARCRRKNGKLYVNTSDRTTIERSPTSTLVPKVGDFAFRSTDNVWSLWAIREKGK